MRAEGCELTGEVGLEAPFAHELGDDVDGLPSGHHSQQLDEFGVMEALQRLDLLHELVLLGVLWSTDTTRPLLRRLTLLPCLESASALSSSLHKCPVAMVTPLSKLRQHPLATAPPCVRTLFQRLDGYLPVLGRPVRLPHLSKVPLPQLLQEAELLSRPLPRLHVEEFPLHTDRSINPSINQSVN